jgi:hypothetical protein
MRPFDHRDRRRDKGCRESGRMRCLVRLEAGPPVAARPAGCPSGPDTKNAPADSARVLQGHWREAGRDRVACPYRGRPLSREKMDKANGIWGFRQSVGRTANDSRRCWCRAKALITGSPGLTTEPATPLSAAVDSFSVLGVTWDSSLGKPLYGVLARVVGREEFSTSKTIGPLDIWTGQGRGHNTSARLQSHFSPGGARARSCGRTRPSRRARVVQSQKAPTSRPVRRRLAGPFEHGCLPLDYCEHTTTYK